MLHSLQGTLPHFILEACAYLVGGRVYWHAARGQPMPAREGALALIAGAILGALAGSKVLHIAEHQPAILAAHDAGLWIGGKSILGGFIGGTFGVEVAKRLIGWRTPTGDTWVPAIAAGLVVGRLGCQLSGTWDLTYGTPTSLPWGWDYGDGIPRHPTAAYEMIGVALLWAGTVAWRNAPRGARFAAFLLGYCALRFLLEFLKPPCGEYAIDTLPVARYAGLTAIQWAAVLGGIYYTASLRMRLNPPARS